MASPRARRLLEASWVVLTVGYAVLRAVVVARTLHKYGVNPWVYGGIDVATSFPLGLATARCVGAAVDHDWTLFRRWAFVAALAFFAPDVSILVMGRGMPIHVYVVLGTIVTVTTGFALRSVWRKIRAGHQHHHRHHHHSDQELERL